VKTNSNQSNVVILGRPLIKQSSKNKLQKDMEKIGDFYNPPSVDGKENVCEYSRELVCD
jgi:hypothetical protein